MNIALIPARGGSKRIKNKNIKLFNGKPIIQYSIDAAFSSGCFDKVIVSTDSNEIADFASGLGCEVPFKRPANISDDYATTAEVIDHALNYMVEQKYYVKYVCCIYATAPFIKKTDIIRGFELIDEQQVSSVFTVTTFPFPIQRALRVNSNGALEMFSPEHELTRSNNLEDAYHDAGQFYWLNAQDFHNNKRIYTKDAMPLVLERKMVQDIDTQEDWNRAEKMFEVLKRTGDL